MPARKIIARSLAESKYVRIFANNKVHMAKQQLTEEQERIARFAKALGHPIRIAILQMLASQTCCFHGDMSEILPIAKSTLSQHLKELKDAGLIQGEINLPSVKYCINRDNWALAEKTLGGFLDRVAAKKRCCE